MRGMREIYILFGVPPLAYGGISLSKPAKVIAQCLVTTADLAAAQRRTKRRIASLYLGKANVLTLNTNLFVILAYLRKVSPLSN